MGGWGQRNGAGRESRAREGRGAGVDRVALGLDVASLSAHLAKMDLQMDRHHADRGARGTWSVRFGLGHGPAGLHGKIVAVWNTGHLLRLDQAEGPWRARFVPRDFRHLGAMAARVGGCAREGDLYRVRHLEPPREGRA